jgi:dUTP pyrophosphatase
MIKCTEADEMKVDIRIKKLRDNAVIPTYGSDFAAGADLYAALDEPLTINPGETKFVPTGLAFEIPEGYAGFIYARSGLASKRGLAPANKVGVIDSDYRGEVMVALVNLGQEDFIISDGDRIAQMVLCSYERAELQLVDELAETERGSGGFGSTGEK